MKSGYHFLQPVKLIIKVIANAGGIYGDSKDFLYAEWPMPETSGIGFYCYAMMWGMMSAWESWLL